MKYETRVEQHQITKNDSRFKESNHLCFLSKNLYNATLYTVRQCIIVLNVKNVNKIAIDKKPTLVSENMYDKENNKYAVQEGFYLIDNTKGTQTVEQENTIVDAIIKHLTGSSKPELKLLP